LQRWIDAGEVPVVVTPSGKQEVPIPALLDLYEWTSQARDSGQRRLHLMEPALVEGRMRAEALDPKKLVTTADAGSGEPHDRAERRNRAYHAAVARRLTREMVQGALISSGF
jgi:hypothetical protein